jgi:hypothetical protein
VDFFARALPKGREEATSGETNDSVMAAIVDGANALDAWKRGVALILADRNHVVRNLITEIRNPSVTQDSWYSRYNPQAVGAADSMSVVAQVLFPRSPKRPRETRLQFYTRHETLLKRALRMRTLHSTWRSTYFQRLISMDGSENQLERALRALTTWQVRSETGIVAHLSTPKIDGLRKRGSPCLQYLEVLWREGNELDLVAVYRNHDFLGKALGNFVGLGRILEFLTSESNKRVGRVICHSVRAYTESVGKLRQLEAR